MRDIELNGLTFKDKKRVYLPGADGTLIPFDLPEEADRALSPTSEKPVQNRVVYEAIKDLAGDVDLRLTAIRAAVGSPLVANTAAAMTDQDKIFVYTGDESGFTAGNWYYYDGTAWVSGGVYNSQAVETDTTLSVSGVPADSKVAGDEIDSVKSATDALDAAVFDVRSLKVGSVHGGRYYTDGYSSLGSTKWIYSDKFLAGRYTFTPPTGWDIGYYYYDTDSTGTQIYAMSEAARTFDATRPFIVSGRKSDNTDYTSAELSAFENDFVIVKYAESDNNLTKRVTELENTTTKLTAFNSVPSWKSWSEKRKIVEGYDYLNLLSAVSTIDRRNSKSVVFDNGVKFKGCPASIKQTTNSASTNSEMRFTLSNSFLLNGAQEFEMWLYTEDAGQISEVRLATIGSGFDKTLDVSNTLKNGWNKLRFYTEGAGVWDGTVDTTVLRVLVYTTAEIDVWVGGLWIIKPPKANMMIISDGPYYTFYNVAYPALKAAGIPVVWAIDPAFLSNDPTHANGLINLSDLDVLANDGISEFSFHSYDGTIMSSATADEALADTLKSIHFLKEKGLQPNHIWRAAWLQNACNDPSLANTELEASATYTGLNMVTQYPFLDRYNIPRMAMANRTQEYIDDLFAKMERQHCTVLFYAHGISTGSDKEITPTLWDYYLSKMTSGITAGYLNPTTYSRLVAQYPIISE